MIITSQRPASPYVVAPTNRGENAMSIRAHTVAVVIGVFAIVLVVAAGIAEMLYIRHLAAVLVVTGAVLASMAGMLAASDAARKHRK
jgi:hypothetical protein